MSHANGTRRRNGRRPQDFGRKSIAASFVHALRVTRTSRASAARSLGVTARTVRNWLSLATPIAVELIANVPKLAEPFASCFAVAMKQQARAERRAR